MICCRTEEMVTVWRVVGVVMIMVLKGGGDCVGGFQRW